MARPKGNKKARSVRLWVTDEQWKQIRKSAANADTSVAAFVAQRALEPAKTPAQVQAETEEFARLFARVMHEM